MCLWAADLVCAGLDQEGQRRESCGCGGGRQCRCSSCSGRSSRGEEGEGARVDVECRQEAEAEEKRADEQKGGMRDVGREEEEKKVQTVSAEEEAEEEKDGPADREAEEERLTNLTPYGTWYTHALRAPVEPDLGCRTFDSRDDKGICDTAGKLRSAPATSPTQLHIHSHAPLHALTTLLLCLCMLLCW